MESPSIKDEFHRLIDGIQNEAILKDLFDSVAELARQDKDVFEDLSAAEIQRLNKALDDVKAGKTIPDLEFRKKNQH